MNSQEFVRLGLQVCAMLAAALFFLGMLFFLFFAGLEVDLTTKKKPMT